ncbi:MAG: DUF6600 domain-containing protein, partial [Terriglobales bacterium]
MAQKRRVGCWAGTLMAVLLVAGAAFAAAPGVARISLVQGQASLLRSGATAWGQALLNTPLVEGDEVYTAPGARMEIEFDYAHRAWLAGGSDLVISAFAGQQLQLQLKSGTLSFASLPAGELQTEIDLPDAGVRPLNAGQWRADVVDAAHASVTVNSGTAQVFTPQGSVEAQAGQQIQIAGSQGNAQYQTVAAPAEDAWDQWVTEREQRVEAAADYRDQQVSTSVSGAEDLDAYGHWVDVPGYGQCWTPYAAGFQPYYDGQWVWTPYYGWSWVSYEPWGWAPFHYGRWFWQTGVGWAWWPGGFAGPAVWAPAYVSFFVGGPGWGAGFGRPVIGWVALAPGERYVGYSQTRWIARSTPVTQIYRPGANAVVIRPAGLLNAHAPGGVVTIPQGNFAGGAVNRFGGTVAVSRISRVGAVHGTAPVAPAAGRTGLARARVEAPREIATRSVFRHGAAAPAPARPGLAEVGREIQTGRAQAGLSSSAGARQPNSAPKSGWKGFTPGGRTAAPAQQGPAQQSNAPAFQNHPMGTETRGGAA